MSKGDTPRGSQDRYANSALWCDTCGKMRKGKECKCNTLYRRPPGNHIMDTLLGACGYEVKDEPACAHKWKINCFPYGDDVCELCGEVR